jgi:hypothetical protein
MSDFESSRFASADDTRPPETGTVKEYRAALFFEDVICSTGTDALSFQYVLQEILTTSFMFPHSELPFPLIPRLHARVIPTVPAEDGPTMPPWLPVAVQRGPKIDRLSTLFRANFAQWGRH